MDRIESAISSAKEIRGVSRARNAMCGDMCLEITKIQPSSADAFVSKGNRQSSNGMQGYDRVLHRIDRLSAFGPAGWRCLNLGDSARRKLVYGCLSCEACRRINFNTNCHSGIEGKGPPGTSKSKQRKLSSTSNANSCPVESNCLILCAATGWRLEVE